MSTTIGTHNGRLSDEHRARQQAKALRNRSRRSGIAASNGTTTHAACNSYAACTHAKHGYTPGKAVGRMKNNRGQVWPIPVAGR